MFIFSYNPIPTTKYINEAAMLLHATESEVEAYAEQQKWPQ